jgi:hypothetical protein
LVNPELFQSSASAKHTGLHAFLLRRQPIYSLYLRK